jgi:hypothetical protein
MCSTNTYARVSIELGELGVWKVRVVSARANCVCKLSVQRCKSATAIMPRTFIIILVCGIDRWPKQQSESAALYPGYCHRRHLLDSCQILPPGCESLQPTDRWRYCRRDELYYIYNDRSSEQPRGDCYLECLLLGSFLQPRPRLYARL